MILSANLSRYLSFITALTVIVNPIGAAPLFIALTEGVRPAERRNVATTACITAGAALIVSIAFGQSVLNLLGIRLPAFRVGGGIVLLLMGIAMLHARRGAISHTREELAEAAERAMVGAVPLGIPLLVGPGAISTAVLAADGSRSWPDLAVLVIIAAAVSAGTWLVLIFADRTASLLGKTGINIASRVMGFLLVAIATQFIADGLVELFPVLAAKPAMVD
jgi:multiple antibiotic resistance protein